MAAHLISPPFPGRCQCRLEQEVACCLFPVPQWWCHPPPSSAKLQLVTGWTPHMSGKGGEVHKEEGEGENGEGECSRRTRQMWDWMRRKSWVLAEKRKRRRERLWVKRLGEGERKGVVKNRGTDEGPWVCPHLLWSLVSTCCNGIHSLCVSV